MANSDIRKTLKKYNLKHWQLAEELKISEFKLCRMFRHELSDEEKNEIIKAIDKLNKKRN